MLKMYQPSAGGDIRHHNSLPHSSPRITTMLLQHNRRKIPYIVVTYARQSFVKTWMNWLPRTNCRCCPMWGFRVTALKSHDKISIEIGRYKSSSHPRSIRNICDRLYRRQDSITTDNRRPFIRIEGRAATDFVYTIDDEMRKNNDQIDMF